jgi:hypothetical protein
LEALERSGAGTFLATSRSSRNRYRTAGTGTGRATKQPSADPPDPTDIEGHAQCVFEPSMTPHEAETGMSFIITRAQKEELRRRGYSEEQIREMKPEDAHRALGLIS